MFVCVPLLLLKPSHFLFAARIFRKHRRYWYSYVGTVENGIKGASENAARMRISATVAFDYVNTCEYSMEVCWLQFNVLWLSKFVVNFMILIMFM